MFLGALVVILLSFRTADSFDTHADFEPATTPKWATESSHSHRTLSIDVKISSQGKRATVHTDYELRLPAKDELIPLIRNGTVGSARLAKYLGKFEANSPVTLEQASAETPAFARFQDDRQYDYGSTLNFQFGSSGQVEAGDTPRRNMLITVEPGIISKISSPQTPTWQDRHAVYFDRQWGSVVVTMAADRPLPSYYRDFGEKAHDYFDSFFTLAQTRGIIWLIVILLPWFVVLRLTGSSVRSWFFRLKALRPIAFGAVTVAVVTAMAKQYQMPLPGGFSWQMLCLAVGPIFLGGAILVLRGKPIQTKPVTLGLLGAAVVLALVAIVLCAISAEFGWMAIIGAIVSVALLCGLGARCCFGTSYVLLGVIVGVIACSYVTVASVLLMAFGENGRALLAILIGILTLGLLVITVRSVGYVRGVVIAILGSLLFVPVIGPLRDMASVREIFDWVDISSDTVMFLTLFLFLVMISLLHRAGRSGAALQVPATAFMGLVLMLIAGTDSQAFSWWDIASILALLLGWWYLMPAENRHHAAVLAKVNGLTHRELVTAETRRRLAQLSAYDLYRKSRSRLADAETSLTDYDHQQRDLDAAANQNGHVIARVPIGEALCTGGGATPWQNARRAVQLAIPLALLLIGYEVFALAVAKAHSGWVSGLRTAEMVGVVLHLARWPVYALIFGYFFPFLRGASPVGKAVVFAAAVLPSELLPIFDVHATDISSIVTPVSAEDLVLAVLIRIGQIIAYFATLGLLWERSLMRMAGYPWGRVRNIRSLRALATPVTTVLIAVLTAAGTAIAGVAVAALLSSGANTPTPTSQTPQASAPK
jgi:hypothetical protein